ncbi:C40 family peptidase [Herbidospora mongoliensis]|uniref:C40 family peptidase n=1 Tax=Herbidospora mongoliensis TaxID=688067 RepID=UPI00082D1A50|nr:NlpC/P60 family protein [Herbidospora mongoliensis]
MLTTLVTAILCTPGVPGPELAPCPAPASFRYVFRAPSVLSDDPDDLDELIDLADLAEEWGHTWPPPEWEGFDPWAADGPWAEAWDDLDMPAEHAWDWAKPGVISGPADRDLRPLPAVGAILDGTVRPLLEGTVRPLLDGGVTLDGRAPLQEGAVPDRGGNVPSEAAASTKGSDDRRPRAKTEEPPAVETKPRKKQDDREPREETDRDRSPRDSSPGSIALRAATNWLGIPYVWGGGNAGGPSRGVGKGANRVGFDCSGLTLAAWAKAGVTLGHYTGTQIRQGKPIQTKDLIPGDLLFFGATKTDPSHVGLYAGDGDMIHAPRTGDVVKRVEVLSAPFWTKRFQGAVRPSLKS